MGKYPIHFHLFSIDLYRYVNFLDLTLPVNTVIKKYHHDITGIFTLNLHNLYICIVMYTILYLQVVCTLKKLKTETANKTAGLCYCFPLLD